MLLKCGVYIIANSVICSSRTTICSNIITTPYFGTKCRRSMNLSENMKKMMPLQMTVLLESIEEAVYLLYALSILHCCFIKNCQNYPRNMLLNLPIIRHSSPIFKL